MTAYADTSFVVSLYRMETNSAAAAAAIGNLHAPVWLSPLGELELHNAFQLSVFRGEITPEDANRKWALFAGDLATKVFTIPPILQSALHARAVELSTRHSSTLGTRSLDLMHVAAAMILEADLFLSFDERQRKVAKMEELKVGP